VPICDPVRTQLEMPVNKRRDKLSKTSSKGRVCETHSRGMTTKNDAALRAGENVLAGPRALGVT